MSGRIWYYEATIPAGTPLATPATVPLAVDPVTLASVVMLVPPGPHGNLGFVLLYGDGQVYPFQVGTWLVADDTTIEYAPPAGLSSGSWALRGYNLGAYNHTVYVTLTATAPAAVDSAATVITPVAVG